MKRLQRSTYIKFLQFPGFPDQFLLDLQATILPPVLPEVKDILASIRACDKHMHPGQHQLPHSTKQIPAHWSTVPAQVFGTACVNTT